MGRKRMSKSALFLMELLIVILFFSLTAAICMQIFSQAKITADKASELSAAITEAQNAAELYKANGGNLVLTAKMYDYELKDLSITDITFDVKDGLKLKIDQDTDQSGASYYKSCTITVCSGTGKVIYKLSVNAVDLS